MFIKPIKRKDGNNHDQAKPLELRRLDRVTRMYCSVGRKGKKKNITLCIDDEDDAV